MLIIRAQVQVLDVHSVDLRGAGAADAGGLEQHPVAQHAEWHVLARPPGADHILSGSNTRSGR